MLVLTRKKEETIRIGQDITIRILRIKGRSVQIGVQAPKGVPIARGELIDAPPKPAQPAKAIPIPSVRARA